MEQFSDVKIIGQMDDAAYWLKNKMQAMVDNLDYAIDSQYVVVFDDDEFAVTPEPGAGIHHLPTGACGHGLPCRAGDVDPLEARGFRESSDDLALRRPHPFDPFVIDVGAGRGL